MYEARLGSVMEMSSVSSSWQMRLVLSDRWSPWWAHEPLYLSRKARFFDSKQLDGMGGEQEKLGIFARDPDLKNFLISPVAQACSSLPYAYVVAGIVMSRVREGCVGVLWCGLRCPSFSALGGLGIPRRHCAGVSFMTRQID